MSQRSGGTDGFWRRWWSAPPVAPPREPSGNGGESITAFHEGRYGDAEKLLLAAVRRAERDDLHPLKFAGVLIELADVYRVQAKYQEAEPLYERAIAIEEEHLGSEAPALGRTLNNLALVYRAQGLYDRAEPLCRRALEIVERFYGRDHPNVAAALGNLLAVYLAQGRYVEAGPLFRRSVAIKERILGPRNPALAGSLRNYAAFLRKTSGEAEAAVWEARALAIGAVGVED